MNTQQHPDGGAPPATPSGRKFAIRKLLTAAAVTGVAVTGAVAGGVAASASQATGTAGGTEYIQVMSTSTAGGPAVAIARGVFTAAGQAHFGQARIGTIVFPGGTITLSHRVGRETPQLNPRTCLNLIGQSGTYQIVGGTGRYAGISGHGTYQLSLEFISAREHGQCSSSRPPVAQQELLRLAGPVRL
jgi:hypothetical protein